MRNKISKFILYPHMAVMIILLALASVLLTYSLAYAQPKSPIAIASYLIASYTLTVWCMRIPDVIRFFKGYKVHNKYAKRWMAEPRVRVMVSLYGTLIWNAVYGAAQLALGLWNKSFWYFWPL